MRDAIRPRMAAFMDVENLLHEQPISELSSIVEQLRRHGDLLHAVAVGNRGLMGALVPALFAGGVRGFVHRGGCDAADRALIERIRRDLPPRADTVVIGSGDHAFAPVARELRARGVRVIVVARERRLSHLLYAAADEVVLLPSRESAMAG